MYEIYVWSIEDTWKINKNTYFLIHYLIYLRIVERPRVDEQTNSAVALEEHKNKFLPLLTQRKKNKRTFDVDEWFLINWWYV